MKEGKTSEIHAYKHIVTSRVDRMIAEISMNGESGMVIARRKYSESEIDSNPFKCQW